jgi:murein L,D-transpeptidase YcbB/YkuD
LVEGVTVRSFPVSIGKPTHRTPRGNFTAGPLILNPSWTPPDSEWARGRSFEPPGPNNPTGRAKFQFHGLIYLHGTADMASLGRAASHGCVRLSNTDVLEVSRRIHQHLLPHVSIETIDSAIAAPRRTRTFQLAQPVPVSVVYETVEFRDGKIEIHPDVYRLDAAGSGRRDRVLALIRGAGYEPASVDPVLLAGILADGNKRTVAFEPAEVARAIGNRPLR